MFNFAFWQWIVMGGSATFFIIILIIAIAKLGISIKKGKLGLEVSSNKNSTPIFYDTGIIKHHMFTVEKMDEIGAIKYKLMKKKQMIKAEQYVDSALDYVMNLFFSYLKEIRGDGSNILQDPAYKEYNQCILEAKRKILSYCNNMVEDDALSKAIQYELGYEVTNPDILNNLVEEEKKDIDTMAIELFKIVPGTLDYTYNNINPTRQDVMLYNIEKLLKTKNPAEITNDHYRNSPIYSIISEGLYAMRETTRGYHRAIYDKHKEIQNSLDRTTKKLFTGAE